MTPILKVRSFTTDQFILDKAFYSNFYRLRGFSNEERKPIVVDIGAHCGYFSFSALALGAKRVYAFEPFTPNYKMLLQNLGENQMGQVIPYQLGVYVDSVCMTFNYPELFEKSFFDFANVGPDLNTTNPEFCKCCMISMDSLLENYVAENVDILKLSIGYAEMAILSVSKKIETMVSHLCGEISLDEAGQLKFKSLLATKGFIDSAFYPSEAEENKILFHASKTKRDEVFK